MYQHIDFQPHAIGIERLTGSNRGLFFTNERVEEVANPNSGNEGAETITQYTYDVYEVSDARFPDAVKDEVITQRFPRDEEHKLLRKAIAAIITELGLSDASSLDDFREYNAFVESVKV